MNLLRAARARPVGRAAVGWPGHRSRSSATWISIIPFFAGYLPVLFDRRRRGLPDFVAGTEVVYSEPDG